MTSRYSSMMSTETSQVNEPRAIHWRSNTVLLLSAPGTGCLNPDMPAMRTDVSTTPRNRLLRLRLGRNDDLPAPAGPAVVAHGVEDLGVGQGGELGGDVPNASHELGLPPSSSPAGREVARDRCERHPTLDICV